MKKLLVIALGMAGLLLAGCSGLEKPEPTVEPETQDIQLTSIGPFDDKGSFIDASVRLKELPEGYGYIGNLTEDQALDSGLAGCKVYADLTLDPSERRDVYLYQPVGENGGEWAYVKYVEILYGAAEEQV